MREFFKSNRDTIMSLIMLVLAVLAVTALRTGVSVPIGVLILTGFAVVWLIMDWIIPKETIVQTRSLDHPDLTTWQKSRAIIIYAGSFGLGLITFLISGEEPTGGFMPGPWGTVAIVITFTPPILFSIWEWGNSKTKK